MSMPEPSTLAQAADWLVLLYSGEATAQDHERVRQWRAQDPGHEAAWQRASGVMATLEAVPGSLVQQAFTRMGRLQRRRLVGKLALLMGVAPAAGLAWAQRDALRMQWADVRTGKGEQRVHHLADGGRMMLNTDSAIDVDYGAHERRVRLWQGDILVTVGPDVQQPARPFVVQTPHGCITAFASTAVRESGRGVAPAQPARFALALSEQACEVAVYAGQVQARGPLGQVLNVQAGQQASLRGATPVWPSAVPAAPGEAPAWTRGLLLAQDMPLTELLAQLARYRSGWVRCDPALAGLRVSGAFPVMDAQSSLKLLTQTLPVRVEYLTRYWVRVLPAQA